MVIIAHRSGGKIVGFFVVWPKMAEVEADIHVAAIEATFLVKNDPKKRVYILRVN